MIYIIKQLSCKNVFVVMLLCFILMDVFNLYGIEATELRSRNARPNQQKCQEYIREINNRQKIREGKERDWLAKTNTASRHKNTRRRIILGVHKGKITRASEYPHMGALGWYSLYKRDWEFQCGASLISSNFLLTAAHCTKMSKRFLGEFDTLEPKIVRLGSRNIRKSLHEIPHDFDIKQIKVHEKYMSPYNNYDIALLKLSRPVKFNKFIHPACLGPQPSIETVRNRRYTVTGWGGIAHVSKMVDDLRYGEVDLIDQKKCDFYIRPYRSRNWNKTAPHQICAGKMDGSVDTCNGDSGGPLQYKILNTKDEGTMHTIIGITAFGSSKCATKNLPSIYTKVEFFIPWIEKTVWPIETRNSYNKYANNKRVSLYRRRHFKNDF